MRPDQIARLQEHTRNLQAHADQLLALAQKQAAALKWIRDEAEPGQQADAHGRLQNIYSACDSALGDSDEDFAFGE